MGLNDEPKKIVIAATNIKNNFFISILAVFILSPAVLLMILFSLLYYGFSGFSARTLTNLRTQKKRGTFSPSLVVLRSWTTYNLPITTSKAHATWREHRCFTLGNCLKVSKFQNNQLSYSAFSYSMMCISLEALSHRLMF